jgi:Tol biopolymer transport system component
MPKPISSFIVVALAAGLLVAAPAPASAVNGRIAFASGRGGNQTGMFEIWTMDATGGGLHNVTRSPGAVDLDPSWSPDGLQIAFARQGANAETFSIFVESWNGSGNATRLTSGSPSDRQPDWSALGEVAFVRSSRATGSSLIFKISTSGGSVTQLTATAAPAYDASPAWSPDGAQIAFVSDRSGSPQLHLMDSSGGGETQLTFDPCWVANPAWSPDGSSLVYERLCPGATSDVYQTTPTAPATGSPLVADPALHEHQPSFSPDGDQVVFTRVEADGNKDLHSVLSDGTGAPVELTAGVAEADLSADWGINTTAREVLAATTGVVIAADRGTDERTTVRAPKRRKGKKKKRKLEKFRVSPGVRYVEFRKAKSDGYMLRVDPKQAATLDVALAKDRLAGHERTRSMAKRHGAVAAINGDFGTPSGRPSHTFAEDGDLKQVSFAVAWNFAITRGEDKTFFARPFETITAQETDAWRIDRWNFGQPGFNDIAAFTAAGQGLETPPGNSCSARLAPAGDRRQAAPTGVETPYSVSAVGCSATPMSMNGGIVLAARPGSMGAILLSSLTVGETVDITWSLGWENVVDTLGGTPLLLDQGQREAEKCPQSICAKHPRTAIGVTSQGKILLVVIDGRRTRSAGVTLVKLASVMKSLGAVSALNLDGGGSSTMVVKGRVKNVPSDGKERPVSSAILVLPGGDQGETIGAVQPRTAAPREAPGGDAAVLDPASTGGLLEAMAAGTFGRRAQLPVELRRALAQFRASR